jgi:broad specificity phosphatase PhoE
MTSRLNPITFLFLRHGETDWNAQNLSQGNVDVPLNETGLAQARSAALLLRDQKISHIIASPLSRARVTAETVAREHGMTVEIDEGLHECSFGVQEGKPMSQWFQDWVDGLATPDGAESFTDLIERSVAAINRCTARPPTVLIVAHGAVFRAMRAVMGLEPNVRTRNAVPIRCTPPEPGSSVWSIPYID